MLDKDQTTPQEDEVILTVRYSGLIFWLGQAFLLFGGCAMIACVFPLFREGEYLKMVLVVPGGLLCLHGAVIQSLNKHLLFCQDRVVQVWHFLGQKTIYYTRARVETAPDYVRWLQKGFCIKDVNDERGLLTHVVRISYNRLFVPSDTAKKVDKIMAYLTEDSETNSGWFSDNKTRIIKHKLPKEVI